MIISDEEYRKQIWTGIFVACLILILFSWAFYEIGKSRQDIKIQKVEKPIMKEVTVYRNVTIPFNEQVDEQIRTNKEIDEATQKWVKSRNQTR